MRSAGSNTEWLFDEKNENVFVGIFMEANHCAEHEHGIKEISGSFGVGDDLNVLGIERRRITNVPDSLWEHEFTEAWRKDRRIRKKKIEPVVAITFRSGWRNDEQKDNHIPRELYLRTKKGSDWKAEPTEMGAAWSGESFGIMVQKSEDKKHLQELMEAIRNNNVAIWTCGSKNPFGGGGLVIAIIDRVPADQLKQMKDADIESARLKKASDETGIIQKLKDGGKCYFACSPSFTNVNHKLDGSRHPVIYWLNPMEQRENSAGWYTVEELEQWIEGQGPVLFKKKAV